MSEPITTSTGIATASVTGITFLSLIAGLDAGVVVGAFAGSIVFILTADDISHVKKLFLFFVSFLAGIIASAFLASMITIVTPEGVFADRALGALISSAVAVRLLMFLSVKSKNPADFIREIKRDNND